MKCFVVQPSSDPTPLNKKLARLLENQTYTLIQERHSEIATLKAALELTPKDQDLLYIHSHSVPMISRSEFEELLIEVHKEGADFFSLCRWMDRCHSNADYRELTKTIYSVRTRGAFNLHVAWISHKVRDFFQKINYLGEILQAQQDGKLYSRVTFTNCFEYDLSKASSDVDRLRRFPCQFAEPTRPSEIVSFVTAREKIQQAKAQAEETRNQRPREPKSEWPININTQMLVRLLFILLLLFIIWRAFKK